MAKVGTAHVEIKPVLNEGALDALTKVIEDRIANAVAAGIGEEPTRMASSFRADRTSEKVIIDGRPFPYYVTDDITAEVDGPLVIVRLGLIVDGAAIIDGSAAYVPEVVERRTVTP